MRTRIATHTCEASSPIALHATLNCKKVSVFLSPPLRFLTSNDSIPCTALPARPHPHTGAAALGQQCRHVTCQVGLFPGLDTRCGVCPSLQCGRKHVIYSVQVAHSPPGRAGTRKHRWVEEEGRCLRTRCKAINERGRDVKTLLGCWWGGSSLLPMFNLRMVTVATECMGQGPCLMRLR